MGMAWITMMVIIFEMYVMLRRIERLEDRIRELRAKGAFDAPNVEHDIPEERR